jgi:hypothetical protein
MKKILMLCMLAFSFQGFSLESPDDVSKVDNRMVKVGDRNEYLYSYHKINIGTNLFLLPQEIYSISLSHALNDNVAVRVSGIYSDLAKDYSSASIGTPIYFRKMYTGFFVEPGVDSKVGVYAAGGYHWMWDSGFNVFVGAGAAKKGGVGFLQVAYAFGQ